MDDVHELGEPFIVPELWAKSSIAHFESHDGAYILDDLDSQSGHWEPANGHLDYFEKPLPDLGHDVAHLDDFSATNLDAVRLDPLEDIDDLGSSTPSLSDAATRQAGDDEDDIWCAPELLALGKAPPKPRTWESFYDENFRPARTCYISEGGPGVIDDILALRTTGQEITTSEFPQKHILKSDPLLAGLMRLVMGQESTIFLYNETERTFQSRFGSVRMSGYCPETFDGLVADLVAFANRLVAIKSFVSDTYTSSRSCRSLIAVANHILKSLLTLQAGLHQSSQATHSLLQLQSTIQEPDLFLTRLVRLLPQIRNAKGDEETLSALYSFAEDSDHSTWGRSQILDLLRHATQPWLLQLSSWMGFQPDHWSAELPAFVGKAALAPKDGGENGSMDVEIDFDAASLPTFLNTAEGEAMFEVGQGLRILRAHAPQHPVAQAKSSASGAPDLEMQFSWQDVERIEAQAKAYEAGVMAAIRIFDGGKAYNKLGLKPGIEDVPVSAQSAAAMRETPEDNFAALMADMEKPLPRLLNQQTNGLSPGIISTSHPACTTSLEHVALFNPPISLVPSLSFDPIVSAQARLVNQSTLCLLFKDHQLRSHLSLQHRYQLLGDGVFASRLSHALFNADVPSAERRKGNPRVGKSGLRLGSRENWPPVSSELRLALMGILSDSYHSTSTSTSQSSADLPGGLSFAIRAMSESELQTCLNPNSITALDFLRLQYKPPPPLDTVISPTSLGKYDTIFKLLLRLNRMLYSVTHFSRSRASSRVAQRFKHESHHFVSCVCSYLCENVTSIWTSFSKKLDALEKRIERYDIGAHDGLKKVREMHDSMLDEMMLALLLRKRQEMVLGLLEEIFELVLGFARREREREGEHGEHGEMGEEYRRFGKKVRVFVSVCRGLSERKAFSGVAGGDGREVEGAGVGNLLLRLEMSGYYSRGDG